jgi:hypothetical protein
MYKIINQEDWSHKTMKMTFSKYTKISKAVHNLHVNLPNTERSRRTAISDILHKLGYFQKHRFQHTVTGLRNGRYGGSIPPTGKRVPVLGNSQTSFEVHPTSVSKSIGDNSNVVIETRA